MESRNYTYNKVEFTLGEFWEIIDLNGNQMATTKSEESAELIVAALNGVAP